MTFHQGSRWPARVAVVGLHLAVGAWLWQHRPPALHRLADDGAGEAERGEARACADAAVGLHGVARRVVPGAEQQRVGAAVGRAGEDGVVLTSEEARMRVVFLLLVGQGAACP